MKKQILTTSLILIFTLFTNYIINAQIEVKLVPDDIDERDEFGRSVAIEGDYAFVSAPFQNDSSGVVYVYKNSGNGWIQEAKLISNDVAKDDLFGYSIGVSGDYLVATAPWDDDNGEMSGAAYIFKHEGVNWIQQAKLIAGDATADDRFGIAADIDGDYVVVGAFFDDDDGSRSGSAYIFKRDGSVWAQQAKLTASDADANDWFGVNLSISGSYAAVSARYDDDMGSNSGSTYIFKRDGTSWSQQAKLLASDGEEGDQFGSVYLVDDKAFVGCHLDDDNGQNSGSVYLFKRSGSTWIEDRKILATDGRNFDKFGSRITESRNRLIISASGKDVAEANCGAIYVLKVEADQYVEEAIITPSDCEEDAIFGVAAADENYVLVGARNSDVMGLNSGAAYIYHLKKEPHIQSVEDVPNDQGGNVTLKWDASYLDIGRGLSFYSIWSALPEGTLAKTSTVSIGKIDKNFNGTAQIIAPLNGKFVAWEWIANQPGHYFNSYTYSAATKYDAMSTTDGIHYFMVSAHLTDESVFYNSNVDSGYSVDNLSPSPPVGLEAFVRQGFIELNWEKSQEIDLAVYNIYRNETLYNSTTNNQFTDFEVENGRSYTYKLTAVDIHENESEFSNEVTSQFSNIAVKKTDIPEKFKLFQNYPNPFNGETIIQYQLPTEGNVELIIYNMAGQKIWTFSKDYKKGGYYQISWNGSDNTGTKIPSGIYVYQIKVGDFLQFKKMLHLK